MWVSAVDPGQDPNGLLIKMYAGILKIFVTCIPSRHLRATTIALQYSDEQKPENDL